MCVIIPKNLKTNKMKVRKLTQMATALVVLLFFSFSAKTAHAQCNDTIATFSSSTVKGSIEFEGVRYTYVSGKKYSTWFYILNVKSGSGFGKDWSHENFQLGKCMVSSMFDAQAVHGLAHLLAPRLVRTHA